MRASVYEVGPAKVQINITRNIFIISSLFYLGAFMFSFNEISHPPDLSRPESNRTIKVFIREAFKRSLVHRPSLSV